MASFWKPFTGVGITVRYFDQHELDQAVEWIREAEKAAAIWSSRSGSV
jgi:hypothetical protein